MKILLVTWGCDKEDVSEPGVTYKWVEQIAKDHEVTVFSVSLPHRYGCVKEQFPDLNVIEWKDVRVPKALERFRSIAKPAYLPYFFKARSFLKKLLSQEKFDVIHQITPFAFRYPTPASGLGVPLVRGPIAGGLPTPDALKQTVDEKFHPYKFLRNTDDLRKKYDPVLRKAYAETDITIIAAPYVLDVAGSLSFKETVVEIELGMDSSTIERIVEDDNSARAIQLLYVGRIIRTKGLRDTIRALKKTKTKRSVVLTVIGDGDDLSKCKAEANDMPAGREVNFLGWKQKKEVLEYYAKSDVFIFPSFREPTGGVLVEAMSNSLPCITCDYGGPAYIVDDKSGILVPPSSEEEFSASLAVAIDQLSDNSELRVKMSHNAWKRSNELFVWEGKRKRLNEIYQKARENF